MFTFFLCQINNRLAFTLAEIGLNAILRSFHPGPANSELMSPDSLELNHYLALGLNHPLDLARLPHLQIGAPGFP